MAYQNKRYKPPSTSDLVRVMTDGPFQGTYHGRPAPGMLGPGVKQPGSRITQREIHKSMYRPVDGRDVADVYGGVIAYTPTEEEYRERAGGAPPIPSGSVFELDPEDPEARPQITPQEQLRRLQEFYKWQQEQEFHKRYPTWEA